MVLNFGTIPSTVPVAPGVGFVGAVVVDVVEESRGCMLEDELRLWYCCCCCCCSDGSPNEKTDDDNVADFGCCCC